MSTRPCAWRRCKAAALGRRASLDIAGTERAAARRHLVVDRAPPAPGSGQRGAARVRRGQTARRRLPAVLDPRYADSDDEAETGARVARVGRTAVRAAQHPHRAIRTACRVFDGPMMDPHGRVRSRSPYRTRPTMRPTPHPPARDTAPPQLPPPPAPVAHRAAADSDRPSHAAAPPSAQCRRAAEDRDHSRLRRRRDALVRGAIDGGARNCTASRSGATRCFTASTSTAAACSASRA